MEKAEKKEKIRQYKEQKTTGGVYAIENTRNGKLLLCSAANLKGSRNLFSFWRNTGTCSELKLQRDWEAFGKDAFVFRTLETLEKKETQTPREFSEDLKTLEELWREKLGRTDAVFY